MKTALLLVTAAVLAACSADAPGPPDLLPPTASIQFPPRVATTDADTLTISGRAADDVKVTAVSVNGVPATTKDGFLTWRAVVPLLIGINNITVSVSDRAGTVPSADSVSVTRVRPLWASPATLAIDGNRAYVADGALDQLFVVDVVTGTRTVLEGAGPAFTAPGGMALDRAGNRLLVSDSVTQALLAVDLATGARTVLVQGAPFASPRGVAVDELRGRALVADGIINTLFGVDLDTGDRTAVAAGFNGLRDVAIDVAGDRAYVVDDDGLHEVDLASGIATPVPTTLAAPRAITFGSRPIVADGTTVVEVAPGGGLTILAEGLSFPRALAFDALRGRAMVIDSGLDALLAIGPGGALLVSGTQTGTGPKFANPRDVTIDPVRGVAYVTDFTLGLLSVDLATGERDMLTGPGPEFVTPLGGAFDRILNRVLVADSGLGALLGVFTATGDRFFLNSELTLPVDVAVDSFNRRVYVADTGEAAIIRVDLINGSRTTMAGVGPPLLVPRAISFSDRILIVDDGIDALLEMDALTGDRTLITAGLTAPSGVAHDVPRGRALITDTVLDSVLAVDLASGMITSLSGSGPRLLSPEAVAVSGDLILVIDSGVGALLAIELTSGDRVIVSK